jgi:hypothetical protein
MLATAFQELAGARLVDDDGQVETLELLPPATDEEIARLEAGLPSPLPAEIREALQVSRGLANGPLESLDLVDLAELGLEDVFPHAHSIGHDGFGNYWVVDLHAGSSSWSPVFFACHDPPVIAFQSETVEAFVRDAVAMWQPDRPRSPVDEVHEDVTNRIWATHPGFVPHHQAVASEDSVMREFAEGLDPRATLVDLRSPRLGDGFAWGRYGPRTSWTRCGADRLWATIPPERETSLLGRLFRRRGGS